VHVSGCELQDRSCDVKGNGREDNRVVIKLEAEVNVKGQGVYSGSVSNNGFRAFIQKHKQRS